MIRSWRRRSSAPRERVRRCSAPPYDWYRCPRRRRCWCSASRPPTQRPTRCRRSCRTARTRSRGSTTNWWPGCRRRRAAGPAYGHCRTAPPGCWWRCPGRTLPRPRLGARRSSGMCRTRRRCWSPIRARRASCGGSGPTAPGSPPGCRTGRRRGRGSRMPRSDRTGSGRTCASSPHCRTGTGSAGWCTGTSARAACTSGSISTCSARAASRRTGGSSRRPPTWSSRTAARSPANTATAGPGRSC